MNSDYFIQLIKSYWKTAGKNVFSFYFSIMWPHRTSTLESGEMLLWAIIGEIQLTLFRQGRKLSLRFICFMMLHFYKTVLLFSSCEIGPGFWSFPELKALKFMFLKRQLALSSDKKTCRRNIVKKRVKMKDRWSYSSYIYHHKSSIWAQTGRHALIPLQAWFLTPSSPKNHKTKPREKKTTTRLYNSIKLVFFTLVTKNTSSAAPSFWGKTTQGKFIIGTVTSAGERR